jgi:hypothetical protein
LTVIGYHKGKLYYEKRKKEIALEADKSLHAGMA